MIGRRYVAWLAVLGLVSLSACPVSSPGGGSKRRYTKAPTASDLEGVQLVTLDIEMSGPAAKRFGDPAPYSLTEVEQAVIADLADEPMTHSPGLSRMVRELASTTPDRINVPPSLVDGLMAWAGLVDPPPRLVVVEMPEDRHQCFRRLAPGCRSAVDSLVEQVRMTRPQTAPLDVGVGVVGLPDGRTRMMVAVLERAVQLEPLPTAVGREGSVTVAGRLLGPRSGPRVEVVNPGGRWHEVPASVSVDGRFTARVDCNEGSGAYQVEVLAEGSHGPEVAANFPVHCGVVPPDAITVVAEQLDPSVTAEQIARANFLYLNEERQARGLPALSWDPAAAVVAHGHSFDMHEHGFVGHRSPTTGDVTGRFSAAGLQGVVIRENVARGYGPRGIHDSLMRSPGHRINMLADDVTHVGVGVVVGAAETDVPGAPRPVFATQNFYRKPGAGAPTKNLGPALQGRIDKRRREAGLAAVNWGAALGEVAQRNAEAIGRGRQPPKDFEAKVFALGYDSVQSHRLSSIDFEALAGVELWNTPVLEAGLGVVRTRERGGGEGFLAVVLVVTRE
ncbi:MAG: CAP domain-containing protein [Deltaproteobacteria bacterium]|nr:CAP domain-containing protein [Deltaproteobacteria bacterium]